MVPNGCGFYVPQIQLSLLGTIQFNQHSTIRVSIIEILPTNPNRPTEKIIQHATMTERSRNYDNYVIAPQEIGWPWQRPDDEIRNEVSSCKLQWHHITERLWKTKLRSELWHIIAKLSIGTWRVRAHHLSAVGHAHGRDAIAVDTSVTIHYCRGCQPRL